MPRWLRIMLISAGSLLVLVIVLWLILALVIRSRKAGILADISQQLSERLNGDLTIRDMEPSLVRSFPQISVTLKDVTLKDSLFDRHGHALLQLKEVYVKVNTFALIRKRVSIREVSLENGDIYLYTDSLGYSNGYLLKGREKKDTSAAKKPTPVIAEFSLENVRFTLENQQKWKHFKFDVKRLEGRMHETDSGWQARIDPEILIQDMQFNTTKGSYAKNKTLTGPLDLTFISYNKMLRIAQQTVRFDQQPVLLEGAFIFSEAPPDFRLNIKAAGIPFKFATTLVTPNITAKLSPIDFEKPLDVEAEIRGHMKFRDTPYVRVAWAVRDNRLTGANLALDKVNFDGAFLNELVPGQGHNDANSRLSVYRFSADYENIPVTADTIRVINLQKPLLTGRFRSNFPLTRLTSALDPHLFEFTAGNAALDLQYAGSWDAKDTVAGALEGTVSISDGAFTYVPRNLAVRDCHATLAFTQGHLYLRGIRAQSGASRVEMDGSILNILNLYFSAPEKIVLNWNVRSPLINLNEFQSFFGRRAKHKSHAQTRQQKHMRARFVRQLDTMLEASSVHMQVAVDKVRYRKFNATNVRADVQMGQDGVRFNKVGLNAVGGQMQLSGAILQQPKGDRFNLDADIRQVQVEQLFYAFENFGQDGITAQNLRGVFSAKAKLTGGMKEDISIQPRSMNGSVTFNLNRGALLDFKPLVNVGKFIFRKRDMSNITFDNIRNTLDIRGNKIYIHPMLIASSVLNIEVEGTYGIPKGTDIKLKVPLRNPKKDELVTDADELRKRRKSGIVVNLHAVDGDDGKVKLKLGKGD
ncbi:AsmA-like C-terminal region-containing protein [Chitinophaga sp. NPDC101104]|uniref:AsmA family protein n=1 Tax=Chitinophaga sp. NPDC101104 TaxID=3390561 RepID=UPI003D0610B2